MSKKDRRQILENLASRIDPKDHAQHLEETLTQLRERASRVMIAVQQIEDDPNSPEVEKKSVEEGYTQLESLLWRIQDCEERLDQMKDAHVTSIAGTARAQKRNVDNQERKRLKKLQRQVPNNLSDDEDDAGDSSDDPPVAD